MIMMAANNDGARVDDAGADAEQAAKGAEGAAADAAPSATQQPASVWLTEEQSQWVTDVREACREAGAVPRSDFELYRVALVCEGSTKDAVERVQGMRKCEAKFDLGSVDPIEAFDAMQRIMPGAMCGYSGLDKERRLVFFCDASAFRPSKMLKDAESERMFMRAFCDMLNLSATSVEEFDRGFVFVQNCKGMSLRNFSLKLEKELSWMYTSGFPVKLKKMVVYNAGPVVRTIVKMCKVFLSKKIQERIEIISGDEALFGLVDAQHLPATGSHGSVTDAQMRAAYIDRVQRFAAFEKSFKL